MILIEGIGSGPDVWSRWIPWARDGAGRGFRTWAFRYDPSSSAEDAAGALAGQLQAESRVPLIQGIPLVLVGHDTGGLVARAFAARWTRPDATFARLASLSLSVTEARVIYLDCPQRGAAFLRNPYLRSVLDVPSSPASLLTVTSADAGAVLPSFAVVPPAELAARDVEVRLDLPGLAGVPDVRPHQLAVVPPDSARATASAVIELSEKDLVGTNEETHQQVSATPKGDVIYHGWHRAVARSRLVFDLVFGKLAAPLSAEELKKQKHRRKPATAAEPGRPAAQTFSLDEAQKAYRELLGRPASGEELEALRGSLEPIAAVRRRLQESVEYAGQPGGHGAAMMEAWRRSGGEAALGLPRGPAVQWPPRSGNWMVLLNPPDGSEAAVFMPRHDDADPRTDQAWILRGDMAVRVLEASDRLPRYGVPLSDAAVYAGGVVRQDFKEGFLIWLPATGHAEFHFRNDAP